MLEPHLVVALRVVGAELRAARLLALDRSDDDGLRRVEHVAELEGAEHVLVEDGAAVVDVGSLRLFLEAAHDLVGVAQAGLVAEDRDVAVHLDAQLLLDLRDAPAGALAPMIASMSAASRRIWSSPTRASPSRGAGGGVLARAPAEDQRVEQRVGAEAVAAVDRDAGHLAGRIEAGDRRRAVDVGLDAAHEVVLAWLDDDRLARDVGAREVAADVDDLAQCLERALARDHGDVEEDAGAALADAAALVDLGLLGARDDVARGQLHLVGRVLLHEALAVGVEQMRALAAGALGDEEAVLGQRRRVVLDHLHVHQRGAGPEGLRDAVTRADERVGRRLVALPGAAGGQDHVLGREGLHGARADVARHDADAGAVVVEDQRGDEPLLVAIDAIAVLEDLLVEHVEHRLAGDVRHIGGAVHRGAAERAQVELARLVAVEGDPDVLEVHDLPGGLAAHDLDGVLVAQEVRALDRVEGVRAPVVRRVDGRVDAAGGRHGVRAHGVDLAQKRHRRPRVRGGQRRALAGETRADDEDVVCRHGAGFYVPRTAGRVVLSGPPSSRRPGAAAASARRTCSSVTTPRRRSSRSMTISAPSERRPSDAQELLDGGVVVDAEGLVAVRGDHSRRRAAPAGPPARPRRRGAGAAARGSAPDRVGDREPGPAVAQEELVLRLETVVSPGTQTGWVSMTSATVTPSRRSEKRLETTAPVADWPEEPAHEDPPDARCPRRRGRAGRCPPPSGRRRRPARGARRSACRGCGRR